MSRLSIKWPLAGMDLTWAGVMLCMALVSCGPGVQLHPLYVTDFSDDRKLVGFADDVFFGQVVESLGTSQSRGLPETQFRVKILETLKGSLSGQITVNQSAEFHGGSSPDELMGEPALLEKGNSYLLVTRRSQHGAWHTVASPYGRILIRDVPKHAPDHEVLSALHANELRERFTKAIEEEIPFDSPQ